MKKTLVFCFGSGIYAIQHAQNIFSPSIRFRVGPDFLGWTLSSQYFKDNGDLSKLTDSIAQQSNIGKFETFNSIQQAKQILYSLPSYNEQVQGEFLVVAKRLGITSFFGSFAKPFDQISTSTFIWSAVCCFSGLLALLVLEMFSSKKFSPLTRLTGFMVITMSPVLMSPISEGGVWHLFVVTVGFLLLLDLQTLIESGEKRFAFATLVILISYGLSITTDALLITFPILILAALTLVRLRLFKGIFLLTLIGFLTLAPGYQFLFESLKNRSNDAAQGGWSPAGLPLLGDLFGLTPWLPLNGIYNEPLMYFSPNTLYSALVSIVTFLIFFKIKGSLSWVTKTYFYLSVGFISLLNLIVLYSDSPNTYIPWKAAWLVSIVLPFLISDYVQNRSGGGCSESLDVKKFDRKKLQRLKVQSGKELGVLLELALYFILISNVIQWGRFETSWFSGTEISTLSKLAAVPNSSASVKLQGTLREIDLTGGCIPWFQQLALIADLRLVSERSAGIKPNPSKPDRPQAFVYSPLDASCSKLQINFDGLTLLDEIEDIKFYEKF